MAPGGSVLVTPKIGVTISSGRPFGKWVTKFLTPDYGTASATTRWPKILRHLVSAGVIPSGSQNWGRALDTENLWPVPPVSTSKAAGFVSKSTDEPQQHKDLVGADVMLPGGAIPTRCLNGRTERKVSAELIIDECLTKLGRGTLLDADQLAATL